MLPQSNLSWAANDLLTGWGSQIAPSLKLRLSGARVEYTILLDVWQSQTILWCSMCDNLSSWRYSMFISLSWSLLPAKTHSKSNCFEKSRLFCALICRQKMYWIWVVRKLEKGKKKSWLTLCSLLNKIKQTFGTRLVYSCAASYYHLQVATINLLRMAVWGKQRLGNPNMINGLFFTPSASSK